jgi:hypothetical protein
VSSIYAAPPVRTDQLAVGAAPLATDLSWTAVQVIVDNPTNQWLYLPAPKRFIDPGRMGAVIPFPGNTQVVAQWQAPVGFVNPQIIAGQVATLVWLSPGIEVAPSPGVASSVNTFSDVLLTDRIDTAAGSNSKIYPMPRGAKTIMVTIDLGNASRSVLPTLMQAVCLPSDFNAILASGTVLNVNPRQLGLVNPEDTAFSISWTMAGANPANVLLDVVVTAENLLNPQNVAFQFDALQNLNVSMASASPASWQAPNGGNGSGTGSIGAGSNLTIVPAPGSGRNTQLFEIELQIVGAPNTFCDLQDDSGNPLGWRLDTTQSGERTLRFYGRNIGQHGVQLHNSSGAATGAINFGSQYNQS